MIKIEKLTKENIQDVSNVEKAYIETPWGYEGLLSEIGNEDAVYVCIKKGGVFAGYGGMRAGTFDADITNIAVAEDFRKMGIGTLIVKELIKKAEEKNLENVFLEVNINNIKAIRLYEKCGFTSEGIRKKYYNNKDDAIIMKYKIR